MMRAIDRLSGALYPLVLFAMLAGLSWNGMSWLLERARHQEAIVPTHVAMVTAGCAVVVFCYVVEKLMPLLALSELNWVYKQRPHGLLSGFDRDTLLQIALTSGFGLLVGACVGQPLFVIPALAIRGAFAFRRPRSLASLLEAGRTRTVGLGSVHVQDNELVSAALASTWISWRARMRGPLLLRRYLRRSYLPLLAILHCATAVATTNVLGPVAILVFLLSWTVLGAGVYRCADVRRLRARRLGELLVVALHALVGALFCVTLWQIPLVYAPLMVAAVAWGSYQRGRPRRVTRLSFADNGMGISVSPELIDYYCCGLFSVVGVWGLFVVLG